MTMNKIDSKKMCILIFCKILFFQQSNSCSSEIGMELVSIQDLNNRKALHIYIEKNFAAIVKELDHSPHATIQSITNKHGTLVGTAFSNVFAITKPESKAKSNYNPTFIRNYFFIRQLTQLDKALSFTAFINISDKKKYVAHNNATSTKNLELISLFINYISHFQEISIKELTDLFNCPNYFRWYTFMFGNDFNVFMKYKACTII